MLILLTVTILLAVAIALYSSLTNPFSSWSIVEHPFTLKESEQGELRLEPNFELKVKTGSLVTKGAELKCGYHIVSNRLRPQRSPLHKEATLDEIIASIHEERFNPQHLFLISGDHFSVLYPRSLGIFYHTLLDSRTALNEQDWHHRQAIYLKTLAYALTAFKDASHLTTTIVPLSPHTVTLVNFHRPPSDTLFSLLLAFERLQSEEDLRAVYPFSGPADHQSLKLQTVSMTQTLLAQHRESLQRHLETYTDLVFDEQTGLVKKELLLSGTKDMSIRSSAFYDNVIFWKTHQLAQELGLATKNQVFLDELKQRIIQAFWQEEAGIFLEDLSQQAIDQKIFSGDWLIALETGFLDPANPEERHYFERSIAYIQAHSLDQPFGLWYQTELFPERQYPMIRRFSPSYGTTSIWSHWGMEYIKALTRLAQVTGQVEYLQRAEDQVKKYEENIVRYQAYPELYDVTGDRYQTMLYRSVNRTGWVVNFEQARAMVADTRADWATATATASTSRPKP